MWLKLNEPPDNGTVNYINGENGKNQSDFEVSDRERIPRRSWLLENIRQTDILRVHFFR